MNISVNIKSKKWKEQLGKLLMIAASIGALSAFIESMGVVRQAATETFWVESWRMGGFLVFAGLFFMLAIKPRMMPGIWELVFFHKLFMVVMAVKHPEYNEAALAGIIDAVLLLFITSAYILLKGWLSWKSR